MSSCVIDRVKSAQIEHNTKEPDIPRNRTTEREDGKGNGKREASAEELRQVPSVR